MDTHRPRPVSPTHKRLRIDSETARELSDRTAVSLSLGEDDKVIFFFFSILLYNSLESKRLNHLLYSTQGVIFLFVIIIWDVHKFIPLDPCDTPLIHMICYFVSFLFLSFLVINIIYFLGCENCRRTSSI